METENRYKVDGTTKFSFLGQRHYDKNVTTSTPRNDVPDGKNNSTEEKSEKMSALGISFVVFISLLVVVVAFLGIRKGKKKYDERKQKTSDVEEAAILPEKNSKRLGFNMEKIKNWNKSTVQQPPKQDAKKSICETKTDADDMKDHEAKRNTNTNVGVNHFVMHSIEQNGVEVIEMNVSACATVPMEEDSSTVSSSSEVEGDEEAGELLLHNSPVSSPPRPKKQNSRKCLFPDLVSGYEVSMDNNGDDMSKDLKSKKKRKS